MLAFYFTYTYTYPTFLLCFLCLCLHVNSPLDQTDIKSQMSRSMTQPLSLASAHPSTSPKANSLKSRPKSLPVSQSESSLDSMLQANPQLLNGKKKKG